MLCAIDLIGVSELLISCDEHADDALPGLLLLFAQGAAQVGEDEQLMRLAIAPEGRAPQLEAPLSGPNGRSIRRGVSPVR